jgi:hypothetical protein
MYFASSEAVPDAKGDFDIWVATRKSRDDDFASPSVVPELSSELYEAPGWVSPDGCRLYLQRGGADIPSRVYVAQKPSPDATPDAGAPAFPPCDLSQPFGEPDLVLGVRAASGADTTARLSRDELTIYFASDRAGQMQIYRATRPTVIAPFEGPTRIDELTSSRGLNQCPTLTPDGLTMYFETTRTDHFQIYKTSRATLASPWLPPLSVDAIDLDNEVAGPYLVPGGALYYHIDANMQLDIFRADALGIRDLSGADWGTDEGRPVVTDDELTMYFASSKADPNAQGAHDIWVATRKSSGDAFGSPSVVVELSTAVDETPNWVSPDGCRLYFDRLGAQVLSRIYVAQKPPPR